MNPKTPIMLSRRHFLWSGLSFAAVPGAAAPFRFPVPTPRPEYLSGNTLDALIARFQLSGSTICCVMDVATGRILEQFRGWHTLPPASVGKILTAAYALETLGSGHVFTTRILSTGPISGGVLSGDLVLACGGDPTLTSDHLAGLIASLRSSGLRGISGRFLVWSGDLPHIFAIDPDQSPHASYSPAVSGIALNFNRVRLDWSRTGKEIALSMTARADRHWPEVASSTIRIGEHVEPDFVYNSDGLRDLWTVSPTVLRKDGARWLPVRRPEIYVGGVFGTLARSQGLNLPPAQTIARLPVPTAELGRHDSANLDKILHGMLFYSTNLTAEMVGLATTSAAFGRPDSLHASAVTMGMWASQRFGIVGTSLVDHSGLGDQSRMSPVGLARMLVQAGREGSFRHLLKPFPLTDPTEQSPGEHSIRVNAKTGTLHFVSGLGGYMTTARGRELAFAIFCADLKTRGKLLSHRHGRLPGSRTWNRRSRSLQRKLIERWGQILDS